jgi:hypothetical protein
MPSDVAHSNAREVAWFVPERVKGGRQYAVQAPDGAPRGHATALHWGRRLELTGVDDAPWLVVRREALFLVTGRARVLASDGRPSGWVRRDGHYGVDGTVRGRFRDARSLRNRASEGVVLALGDLLAGLDGDTVAGSTDAFVLEVDGGFVGSLILRRRAASPGDTDARGGHHLAGRIRDAWSTFTTPRAWCLSTEPTVEARDGDLLIAAALFTAELSRW